LFARVAFQNHDCKMRPGAKCQPIQELVRVGGGTVWAFLEAIESQFNPRGHAHLVENPEKVVTNDLLAARGWPARRVAFTCYLITAGLSAIGWIGERKGPIEFLAVAMLSIGGLLVAALRLGALRQDTVERPSQKEPAIRKKGIVGIGN